MPTFRKLPIPVEAVQFTGDNWAEMHDFTGHREIDGHQMDVFNSMGTYLLDYVDEHVGCPGELWVEANKAWLPIEIGEWVLKDSLGFHPCKDEIFQKTYISEEEYAEFSGVPIIDPTVTNTLDQTATDARMLGRVRMALLMTRPMEEVEIISERLIHVFGHYKVLSERNDA